MYYSKSTGGFYDESLHGARKLSVIAPGWVQPTIRIPDPDWRPEEHPEGTSHPLVDAPDMDAVPEMVEIDNPDCRIPADAVEITDERHRELLAAQEAGGSIVGDAGGAPVSAPPAGPTAEKVWEWIKAERDRRTQAGGYQVAGKWYHSDTFSRTQQMGLVLLGSDIPAGTMWKTMDGSFVAMTPSLASQIFATAAAADIAIFAAAEVHKAAMEASADPAAYDFSAGWPQIYSDTLTGE